MRRRSDDPRHIHFQPDDRSPAALSHKADKARINNINRALKETIRVKSQGRTRLMTRLEAILDRLKRDYLRGDTKAVREYERITQLFLREKDALHGAVSTVQKSEVARRIEVDKAYNEYTTWINSVAYALIISSLEYFHQRMTSKPVSFKFSVPQSVDLDIAEPNLVRFRKQRRWLRDPEVGYGRPPSGTRFREGQSGNPSGKRKEIADAFEPIRSGLRDSVTVLQEGRKVRLPATYVTCVKVAMGAIEGDPAARRQIREWLIELDRWGLLNATATRPKRSRRKMDPEKKALLEMREDAWVESRAFWMCNDLKEDIQRVFGPDLGHMFSSQYRGSFERLRGINRALKLFDEGQGVSSGSEA